MYTIYINNTLPPALAVHEIYRDIFGPPMGGREIRVFWFKKMTERSGIESWNLVSLHNYLYTFYIFKKIMIHFAALVPL